MDEEVQSGDEAAEATEPTEASPAPGSKRPFILSLICIIGGFMFVNVLAGLLHPVTSKELETMFPGVDMQGWLYLEIAKMVGLIGIWFMRRWGVSLYAIATLVHMGWYLTIGVEPQYLVRHLVYVINTGLGIACWKMMK